MQISSDTYFTYDGHQSYLYGLRFAWIEDSPEKVMVSEKKYSHIKNNSQNYFRVANSEYDEPLEFDAMMSSDRVLYDIEVRRIYNKFFDKNQYKVLSLPVNGENIFFNCILTGVEKIEGGHKDKYGVVGFRLKIVCDAPWGWTEKKIVTPVIDSNGRFIIRNRTDAQDFIYPEVIVAVPSGVSADESTRIGNDYSCLGCPVLSICKYGENGSFPSYMTQEEADAFAVANGNLKRSMIINTSDDELRGTCLYCKPDEDQIIKMLPRTGIIEGVSGAGLDSSKYWTQIDITRSANRTMTPHLPIGTHHVHIDKIVATQTGSGTDTQTVSFIFRRGTATSGTAAGTANVTRASYVNGDVEASTVSNIDFDITITGESCGRIDIYANTNYNGSDGYKISIYGLKITQSDNSDPEVRYANSGLTPENAIARTNKKFIRLVPGDNVFYTENIASGDITLKFEEARILV